MKNGDVGSEVLSLQLELRALGYNLDTDGRFGEVTEWCLTAYQERCWLEADGIAGPVTLAALTAEAAARDVAELVRYRGGMGFLSGREGHDPRPHWPGPRAGVTVGPGFDCGYQPWARLVEFFPREAPALELAIGIRGALARELVHDPMISRVRIGRFDAARVLPRIAASFWRETVAAVPALTLPSAPAGAHAALLSLCYNAGADDLAPLRAPAAAGDWRRVAELVAAKHASSASLSRRRRAEASLIGL